MLVVDDDKSYLYLIQRILNPMHHEAVFAENGRQAWDLLCSQNISFVVTDWIMPEMDGVELIQHIRAANFSYYVYIIMLTARQGKDDVVDGLQAGADDYIVKPFDVSELRARISIGQRILELETRLREAMELLAVQATHDSLTGLLNRRALYDVIGREMARAQREKQPISLVMLDLDNFKDVNDKFGHLVGDEALKLLAHTLEINKRTYDHVGRWGGEEFLLVLPGASLTAACHVAERLRQAITEIQFTTRDNKQVCLSASFGVASTDCASGVSFNQLLLLTDQALYLAKEGGRDQVRTCRDIGGCVGC
ncbi:MAG: diguanylate cyclase [Anaerolineales bacterium]|nr:diguanylate cyclase [Anaerolineales bacterium]